MQFFFYVEKAYDRMWREGLPINMQLIGLDGNIFNWVGDFLSDKSSSKTVHCRGVWLAQFFFQS